MKPKKISISILIVLAVIQFLVITVFPNQAHGGKIFCFSLFVLLGAMFYLWTEEELFVPFPAVSLFGLLLVFLISTFFSKYPHVGYVEIYAFFIGLIFILLVSNLSVRDGFLEKNVFLWFSVVGFIVSILCFYQYVHLVLYGEQKKLLIDYLLPPAFKGRPTGVYGQSNFTALFLLLSIISYFFFIFQRCFNRYGKNDILCDLAFLSVSVAFFLSKSRSALLGLIIICCLVITLVYKKKIKLNNKFLLRVFLVLSLGFVISSIPISPPSGGGYVAEYVRSRSSVAIDSRFIFWTAAFLIFLESPILGVGMDQFKLHLPEYARKAHDTLGFVEFEAMGYSNWAHNEVLQIMAESGVFGLLFFSAFIFLLFRQILKEMKQRELNVNRLFLFLLLVPFFVQGSLSWPLRHTALFFIFCMLLGLVFSKSFLYTVNLGLKGKLSLSVFLISAICILIIFSMKEFEYLRLKKDFDINGCDNFSLVGSVKDPYLEFDILTELLPQCAEDKSFFENEALLKNYLPFYENIAVMQGTHSQLYNLALISRRLKLYDQAETALQEAVWKRPLFELGWSVLHALHVEEAVRKTGRPITDFLPPSNRESGDVYDSIFEYQQKL